MLNLIKLFNFIKVRKGQDPIWHRNYCGVSNLKMFDFILTVSSDLTFSNR